MQLHDLYFYPMIDAATVQARVREMGAALTGRFKSEVPLFISVLSGSFVFTSDLIRAFDAPCEVSFVKLSSYTGTQSTGAVQTVFGLEKDLTGRTVIIVEDIVDTGKTLHFFQEYLQKQTPARVCTIAFLRKPDSIKYPVDLDDIGFDIPDDFVVGYGLDYDGLGRNLEGIWVNRPDTD